MDFGLKGRVALVAGSTKGIGRATAELMAREGAQVIVNGRDGKVAAAVAAEIAAGTGAKVVGIGADVSGAAGVDALMAQARAALGGVDILVTNAGGPRPGGFDDLSDADYLEGFNLNFLSTVRMIRAAVPHMRAQRWGRIVNIQSTAIKEPVPLVTLTNSIRPGVTGLAKDLAGHLGADQITVNTILSGPVMTDRLRTTTTARAAKAGISVEEQWKNYLELVPLGRFGKPEDVAAMIVFLASEAAGWITGTVIQVDGGRIRGAV
ncbi:MAG: SDR family oxidoreductase [Betaproteobacteria bacterium]|nr:SDR family oxidoreductase [Betaproteobacteria bacterium]